MEAPIYDVLVSKPRGFAGERTDEEKENSLALDVPLNPPCTFLIWHVIELVIEVYHDGLVSSASQDPPIEHKTEQTLSRKQF